MATKRIDQYDTIIPSGSEYIIVQNPATHPTEPLKYNKSSLSVLTSSSGVSSVAGKTGAVSLTKADVGLTNVDNTADTDKPVSTAAQAALNLKANTASLAPVATSGSYTDLTSKPTIPTVTGTNTGDQALSIAGSNLTISGTNGNTVALPTATASDATTTTKGVVQLAGDLTGTAALPRLADTIGSSGTTGSSGTVIPVITYDTKGRITALSSASVATPTTISGSITESQVTNLTTDLAAKETTANKGIANGYAGLDGTGKVPAAQLPAYVDDVLEYANLAAFPATGTTGIIYVDDTTNKTYRWSGSAYIEISPSPGSTDSVTEGTTNLYYTNARADARITAATGVTVQAFDSTTTKNAAAQTLINKDLTSGTNTFPTLNQNTTGSAATLTTARTIGTLTGDVTSAGSTFNGSAANTNATTVTKINGTSLAGLATGILKNTTTTGVPSIAIAADFPTLNQNTTGTAANITGTLAVTQGGTGATTTTGSGSNVLATSPTLVTPVLGAASATSLALSGALTEISSNGKALSLDTSGNVIAVDNVAPSAGKVIYDKSYWTVLTDFTTIGTAPTLSSGAIRLSMATTTYNLSNQGLELNSPTTPDEMVDFEMTVKVVTLPTTGTGLGLGRQSIQASTGFSMATMFDPFTSPNGMIIWNAATGATGTNVGSKSVSSANVAVGDVLRLSYIQRANTVTNRVENLTQKTVNAVSVTSNLSPTQDFTVPMTSKFRIINVSGTYDIQNIRLVSRQPQAPKVVCIGDSKTAGYSAVSKDMRWASLLNTLGPVAVLAGAGDRTSDTTASASYAAALKPKYAILNIGRNDIAGAVATATWQANYASTVATLKAAGITVIHLLAIPETTNAQTGLNTYINATYASDTRIDVSGSWVNGTHLSSDGTHPSIEGHRLIANTILTNGAIPVSANQNMLPIPSYPFDPTFYDTITDVAPPWIAPTLSGTWVNFGAPWANAGYMKDSAGIVHLQGLVKSGTVGSAIFTLPAGYRPAGQIRFATDAGGAFGAIFITSAGVVTDAGIGSPAVFIALNNVTFKAEA